MLGRYHCILFDGTQHYCSAKKPCEHCLTKVYRNKKKEEVTKTTYSHQAFLNGQNKDIQTNYFEIEQFDAQGKRVYFNTWVTDLTIDEDNIEELTRIGRCRWKIENETFNTLKNQGAIWNIPMATIKNIWQPILCCSLF